MRTGLMICAGRARSAWVRIKPGGSWSYFIGGLTGALLWQVHDSTNPWLVIPVVLLVATGLPAWLGKYLDRTGRPQ